MGTQSFRSILAPISGTGKQTVLMVMERLRANFVLCSDQQAIVPLEICASK